MDKCICCLKKQIDQKKLRGFQAAATTSVNKLLNDGEAIVFDQTLTDIGTVSSLNTTTGVFTVNVPGNFMINYYVNTNGTASQSNVSFAVNGIRSGASSAVQGQMSGFALLSLSAGDTISLTNASGEEVRLGENDIQAGITITTI